MNAPALHNSRALTEQQRSFVDEFVTTGCTATEAARQAGFSAPGQEAYRLMRKPHVLKAVRETRERLIGASLANLAVKTLADVMKDVAAPASARVAAARCALDAAGHFDRAKDDVDKSITEMTNAELQALIAKVDAGMIDAPVIVVNG